MSNHVWWRSDRQKANFQLPACRRGSRLVLAVNVNVLKPAVAPMPLASNIVRPVGADRHEPPNVLVQMDDTGGLRSRSWRALIWALGLEPPGMRVNV